jgi:hypothetical protein
MGVQPTHKISIIIKIYQPQTMEKAKNDTGEVVKLSPLNCIKSKVFIVVNNDDDNNNNNNNNTMH